MISIETLKLFYKVMVESILNCATYMGYFTYLPYTTLMYYYNKYCNKQVISTSNLVFVESELNTIKQLFTLLTFKRTRKKYTRPQNKL